LLYTPVIVVVHIGVLGMLQARVPNLAADDRQPKVDIPMGAGLCQMAALCVSVVPWSLILIFQQGHRSSMRDLGALTHEANYYPG